MKAKIVCENKQSQTKSRRIWMEQIIQV